MKTLTGWLLLLIAALFLHPFGDAFAKTTGASRGSNPATMSYIFIKGDTLWGACRKLRCNASDPATLERIARDNRISDVRNIPVGKKIVVQRQYLVVKKHKPVQAYAHAKSSHATKAYSHSRKQQMHRHAKRFHKVIGKGRIHKRAALKKIATPSKVAVDNSASINQQLVSMQATLKQVQASNTALQAQGNEIRTALAQANAAALTQADLNQAIQAQSASVTERIGHESRTMIWIVAGLACVLILFCIVYAFVMAKNRPPKDPPVEPHHHNEPDEHENGHGISPEEVVAWEEDIEAMVEEDIPREQEAFVREHEKVVVAEEEHAAQEEKYDTAVIEVFPDQIEEIVAREDDGSGVEEPPVPLQTKAIGDSPPSHSAKKSKKSSKSGRRYQKA